MPQHACEGGCPPKEPTIKIAPSLRGGFRERLETLKILAYSKVHVFLENSPSFFDLGGSMPERIQLFYRMKEI